MQPESQSLKCPICKKVYDNYADYFACWTSHLPSGEQTDTSPPYDHGKAIRYFRRNPGAIEKGLRILETEVGIFHGRIDLIGVDKDRNLCIIDVTSGYDWKRKIKQLRRYKKGIEWIGKHIFGVSIPGKVRFLVVKPNDYVKDVTDIDI